LIRGVNRDSTLRVAAVVTTGVAAEAALRHGLSPPATCAVGRALTSGLLLATLTKGGERVTVQLVGDGPIGSITVDASVEAGGGNVRGYAANPDAGPSEARGRLRVADTLGRHGVVNVLRDLGLRERYQGQIALLTGEIDEDLEAYLRTSEQVPSALGCEVVLDDEGRVTAAGGVLVQSLPGSDPESVREVQHALRSGELYRLLETGIVSPIELAQKISGLDDLEFLGGDRPVRFQCRCSEERIVGMLGLLTTVDLDELIADNRPAEITCNFCNTSYQVDRPELERIRTQIAGGPRQSN
jgi:molecular chaperone Hsp33